MIRVFFFFLFVCFSISVIEWEGETLEIARISRLDMGAYLCIASNGVPPSVSKRIKVSVDCEYGVVNTDVIYRFSKQRHNNKICFCYNNK